LAVTLQNTTWLKAHIDAVGCGRGSDPLHEQKTVAKLPLIGFYGLVGSKIDDLRTPIFAGKGSSSLLS
jgi:hypothetical protein